MNILGYHSLDYVIFLQPKRFHSFNECPLPACSHRKGDCPETALASQITIKKQAVALDTLVLVHKKVISHIVNCLLRES